MKTIIRFLLFLVLFCTVASANEVAENTKPSSGKPIGDVKEFYKNKTTCYCTEARTIRLTLVSSELKDINIFECGEKSLVLIKVPTKFLSSKKSEDCGAKIDAGMEGMTACWIKKNYIKFDAPCGEEHFAGDPNVEDRPLCKDLGSVVGAGSCRKDK